MTGFVVYDMCITSYRYYLKILVIRDSQSSNHKVMFFNWYAGTNKFYSSTLYVNLSFKMLHYKQIVNI